MIIGAFNPAAGALAQMVSRAVIAAEAQHGPGNGPDKKQTALRYMGVGAPLAMILLEALGKQVDEQAFSEGMAELTDGMVKVMNAAGVLPKAA